VKRIVLLAGLGAAAFAAAFGLVRTHDVLTTLLCMVWVPGGENYRPSARSGCTPDTGMSHVGFHCVKDTK